MTHFSALNFQEFDTVKNELKKQIGLIMDRHPVFSTALIARRCFASKSASNEYHFGRPGIPVTLRELDEKLSRDIVTFDHFKHCATVMAERMASAVKGEFQSESKTIGKEVAKMIKGTTPSAAPATGNKGGKKGGKQQQQQENSASSEESENAAPPPAKGKKQPVNAARGTKRGAAASNTPAAKTSKAAASKTEPAPTPNKRGGKKGQKPADAAASNPPPPPPKATPAKGGNRRGGKKGAAATAASTSNPGAAAGQNENVPSSGKTTILVSPTQAPAAKAPAKAAGGGRKRKAGKALSPVNTNRGKLPKTDKGKGAAAITAKIIAGSPGSPTKIAVAGNNVVNLSALTQPLPPHVVLPTTPLGANQVQNLSGIMRSSAPPPQLIQLRPTGTGAGSTMQIRPVRAPNAPLAPGQRPGGAQFFKIVGGKPVQISATNLHRLPAGALTTLPPQGRVMYMQRGPAPAASVASAAATATTQQPQGNKIILLSNKGGSGAGGVMTGVAKSGATTTIPQPPSIVRIVSPNSSGKLAISPGSPTKLTTLRPAIGGGAAGASGPILLRTVAPRPGGPPIQLPIAPLPKSALNSQGKAQANDTSAATAKAIQVLLPKSPLPQNATSLKGVTPSSLKGVTPVSLKGVTPVTTTTTTPSGAFVWTNSTRANFKLSSRINFASLDKFKNVVNKDVHFILANIVTEDKSNEFSFRLHLKREAPATTGKGKKAAQASSQQAYLELEAKAKVPTAQEWSLKVKTEPPVFLVSGGNFLADFPAVRIPKDVADKPFVDYELHIDKCSPTQVATGKGAVAKAAAAAATSPAPKRGGRKVASK